MRHKNTKQMLNYWMDLFWEAGNLTESSSPLVWPERSAIQPTQFRTLLGNMFILEHKEGNTHYRLAGTTLCSIFGRELKRETFVEAFVGQDRRSAENWVHRLGLDDYVVLLCSKGENAEGQMVNMETLLLPLSQHGERGNRILGITTPCSDTIWLGTKPIIAQHIKSVRVLRPWENMAGPGLNPSLLGQRPIEQSRRLEIDAPRLFLDTETDVDPQEQTPPSEKFKVEPRQFGHLTVIQGGRE